MLPSLRSSSAAERILSRHTKHLEHELQFARGGGDVVTKLRSDLDAATKAVRCVHCLFPPSSRRSRLPSDLRFRLKATETELALYKSPRTFRNSAVQCDVVALGVSKHHSTQCELGARSAADWQLRQEAASDKFRSGLAESLGSVTRELSSDIEGLRKFRAGHRKRLVDRVARSRKF